MSDNSVEVEELTVRFGEFVAVDRISFSVGRGEIFGFLGANGAGKTTTIRVLCGLLVPSSGKVRVAGSDLENGEQIIKSKVGYMSQKFTLYQDLTVEENLDFSASLRKLDKETYLKRRKELLDFVSFGQSLQSRVQSLPAGIKQQVSLVTSLLHDPDVIFLDEPTAGVSPTARSRFWSLIDQLSKRGKTVFVTTHYMDEAEQCGRIALMREGKIIALDTPLELKNATFPNPMLEFEAKVPISFEEMSRMAHEPIFSFFEPYGFRFHASPRNQSDWEKARHRFEEEFNIQEIKPSLEDVFIQVVEAKDRK